MLDNKLVLLKSIEVGDWCYFFSPLKHALSYSICTRGGSLVTILLVKLITD